MPVIARVVSLSLVAFAMAPGCGARTQLPDVDAPDAVAPECVHALDCDGAQDLCNPVACVEGKCVAQKPLDCDDGNACTVDACTSATGVCTHAWNTPDVDKDGHHAPLPGHAPGSPGACGDDCDDTSAAAFPGNKEICDGVDNDCNGIVDDGARYVPGNSSGVDAVRVSGDVAPAEPGGLAWAKSSYLAGFTGSVDTKYRVFTAELASDGTTIGQEQLLTKVVADAAGGHVVWTGDGFGVTWEDRRTASWEVYFSRLDADGQKLAADVLVSPDDGQWSLSDAIAWTGTEFVVVWGDQVDWAPQYTFSLHGRRLDHDGKPIGADVRLVTDQSESPSVAVGLSGIGVAWSHTMGTRHEVWFQTFDRTLAPVSTATRVTGPSANGVYPTLVWNHDRYVVAWYDDQGTPKAVWAATYDEQAQPIVPAKVVTESPKQSRYPSLLPLGDRVELVFSDTKDQNQGYELYAKQLSRDLVPLEPERRITHAIGDSVWPVAAFGPLGDVGVLFRDDRLGALHVWFSRLACAMAAP